MTWNGGSLPPPSPLRRRRLRQSGLESAALSWRSLLLLLLLPLSRPACTLSLTTEGGEGGGERRKALLPLLPFPSALFLKQQGTKEEGGAQGAKSGGKGGGGQRWGRPPTRTGRETTTTVPLNTGGTEELAEGGEGILQSFFFPSSFLFPWADPLMRAHTGGIAKEKKIQCFRIKVGFVPFAKYVLPFSLFFASRVPPPALRK